MSLLAQTFRGIFPSTTCGESSSGEIPRQAVGERSGREIKADRMLRGKSESAVIMFKLVHEKLTSSPGYLPVTASDFRRVFRASC